MRNWFVLGIAAVVLIGIVSYLRMPSNTVTPAETPMVQAEVATPAPEPTPIAPVATETKAPAIEPPSFDIVRVEPTGEMVVGGRGEPDSMMTLMGDGKPLEAAKVGSNGQFAMVPAPLLPGPHNLTLSMKLADGQTLLSTQNVAVDIPENKNGPLLVAKTEAGKPTQLLTPVAPDETAGKTAPKTLDGAAEPATSTQSKKSSEPAVARAIVAITVVEAEDSGTLYAAGKAAAGATIRLYLNDSYLASAEVGQDAAWALKIAKGVVPGQYRVRADDVDPATGKVFSRAEVAFDFASKVAAVAPQPAPSPSPSPAPTAKAGQPAAAPAPSVAASMPAQEPTTTVFVDSIETATVTRGDSLWRISRKTYGAGVRYTDIHKANQQQIRDPDLIYPGQVFVIPKLKS